MIFYFSGTGNTRWAAEQIAQATGDKLFAIADLTREGRFEHRLAEGERIGFCFPTHGWQPPRIVREFIRRLRLETDGRDHYCWALTTCGDNMGEAMAILNRELAAAHIMADGRRLQAETLFSVVMPESYVCLPFMYTDTDEREREKIDNARRQLHHIAATVKDRERGIEELDKGAVPRIYSYVIGAYFNRRMITDRKFTVDADTCTRCGRCRKVCPTDNITGTPPQWLHTGKCTCCLACYHHCPVHAINYGERTRKRGQYHFNKHHDEKERAI